MNVLRISAFSHGHAGGNPAGVVIASALPDPAGMQATAKAVGYSETVFAAQQPHGWLVRYFSPEAEIPFCGHATIALGAALAAREGDGTFRLSIAQGEIEVEGRRLPGGLGSAALLSPPSSSQAVAPAALDAALHLFGLGKDDLASDLAPAVVDAGARHLLLPLARRETLADMRYDFEDGQALQRREGWVTVLLVHAADDGGFDVRNAFAYGGVYEDPATGAAAAALAGHLRLTGIPAHQCLRIRQGDDMGIPCRIEAWTPPSPGGRVRVAGTARWIDGAPD